MAPFYGWVQLPQGYYHFEEAVTFYHSVPKNSWYSFYRPRKDERLSRPWSHPVVLNTGPLDWESSTLTTRPLLHKRERLLYSYILLQVNSLSPQNLVK